MALNVDEACDVAVAAAAAAEPPVPPTRSAAAAQPAEPSVAAAASSDAHESEISDWDVAMGPRTRGWGMIVPSVLRLAANVVGGAGAMAGYTAGRIGERLGGSKAIDSAPFHAGFTAWLWSNGIFPEVEYEPLPDDLSARMCDSLERTEPPRADDVSLTPLLVSNHVSVLDGLVLADVFGAPRVVAKAKCKHLPLLGNLMREMDTVFVESGKESRQATLEAIRQHCEGWTAGDRPMLIFPEGTMTNGQGVTTFKKGAFIAGVPVRPVVVVYTGQFDPANTTYKMTDHGPRKMGPVEWPRQFFGHFVHSVHIRVLPPYFPSDEERADPGLYAKNCQVLIETALARVREELYEHSWKRAAGREHGGLGYQLGDETAVASRSVFSLFGCGGSRAK